MQQATLTTAGAPPTRRSARPRRRVSVAGVIGELLITAGVITLLYVVWQLWVGDMIYGAQRNATGNETITRWAQEYVPPADRPDEEPIAETFEPIILPEPADTEVFGVMRVPRFGADYAVEMAGGVTRPGTLDPIGIGHYPGSPMPGEVGNFALAGHRTTWGKPFNQVAELRIDDPIVVETADGWYTYRFRTLQYVRPDEVDVLLPVPQELDVEATTSYITLTSCSPMFSMAERIVAYGVFESFTPRDAGAPSALNEGA
ncbi:class E sortase [Microbacterium sp. NPDC055357]